MYRDPTDPPLEIPASQIPRKPKTAKIVAALVVGAAAIAGALVYADRSAEAKKRAAVQDAFGRAASCLIGAPLAEGEKPSARVRAIQLAIAGEDPKLSSLPASEVWPFHCQADVVGLVRVLNQERLAKPGAQDLAYFADQLAQKLAGHEHVQRLEDFGAQVDALFDKAREDKVAFVAPSDAKRAPAPAKALLALDDLRKAKPLSSKPFLLNKMKTEVHRHRELAFVVNDPVFEGGPRLCTVSDAKAACRKLHENAHAGDPQLLAARDPGAQPIVVFGHAASSGAHAADTGAKVIEGEKFGFAWRRKDGASVTLTYRNEYKDKLKLAVDGKAPGVLLAPPGKVTNENLYYAAALVPSWVLFRGANDQGDIRLFAQAIASDGAPSAAQEIGDVDGWWATGTAPQFKSCHSGEALAVLVKDKAGYHVTVEKDGKWTVPAKLDAFGLEQIVCSKTELVATQVSGAHSEHVRQFRCAHGVCNDRQAKLPDIKVKRDIVSLDGGTVVVVSRPSSDRGGVHLTVAPIDALGSARSVPLLDDAFADGKSLESRYVHGLRLESIGSAAILFVATNDGVHVVRIDADGKVSFVPTEAT